MKIDRVLDSVFSRKSNIVVIRALKNYRSPISGREVARLTGFAANNTLSALTYLENLGIVTRMRGGREHLFTLNRKNYIVSKALLPLLREEEEFSLVIRKQLRKELLKKVEVAIIYGSVARKKETEMSDLDLCLIVENSDSIEDVVDMLRQTMYEKYNVNISPLYITRSNFLKKAKNNQPTVNEIIKEGEVIVGQSIKRILNG